MELFITGLRFARLLCWGAKDCRRRAVLVFRVLGGHVQCANF